MRVILAAIAGPSGSGKTFLANKLSQRLGKKHCLIISQDNYYKDWGSLGKKQRKSVNFDHINAFDLKLLARHLRQIKNLEPIEMPCYDFVSSLRLKKTRKAFPKPYVIVEGLMPFVRVSLSLIFDYRVYVDTGQYICLARRIERDVRERGDTIQTVCRRYFRDVLPMQEKYVLPQKKLADFIVDAGKDTALNIIKLAEKIRQPR